MTLRRIGLRLLQLAFLALVAWLVYRRLAPHLEDLRSEDLLRYRPSVPWLIISTALLAGANLLHAFIWRSITVALTGTSFSIRSAMSVFFISSLGRYVPGKVWQLAGMAVLAQREGISGVAAAAASLVGQLAFLTTGIVFLAVLLPGVLAGDAALAALGLLVIAALLFGFGFTSIGRNARRRVLAMLGPRFAQVEGFLNRLTLADTLRYWSLYAFSWLIVGLAFNLLVMAFVPERDFLRFAAVVAASYVGGYISLLPAGVGVRETVMTGLLTPTVGAPAALLISIISRLWFTAGEVAPLIALPLLGRPEKATQ